MKLNKAICFLFCLSAPPLTAQQPLSAIDWLEQPLPVTSIAPNTFQEPSGDTSTGVITPNVVVMPLDNQRSDAVGLLPPATTGLPATLWRNSQTKDLVYSLSQLSSEPLPAVQALYYTLLLAEADAPRDTSSDALFLKARTHALTEFGAVDAALALLERAGSSTPALFDDWFDLALLDGAEDAPCKALSQTPSLSQSYANRIFCTARAGDWATAALIYDTAVTLNVLSSIEETLLAQFLDPEFIDGTPPQVPPGKMTPLLFRLYESVGSPLPTGNLPRAYAMADLRGNSGWRAEVEAAERLARTSALPANRLLGLYTARKPAASGSVWDRIAAVQKLDNALKSGKSANVAAALDPAWAAMRNAGLAIPFAEQFASALNSANLTGQAQELAYTIALLSPAYETAAQSMSKDDLDVAFVTGLAKGDPPRSAARSPLEQAIASAFTATSTSPEHQELLDSGKLGQAILAVAQELDEAGRNQLGDITSALSTLRALGLEDTARRAALQLILLPERS
ncbi:hypothetical protein ROA7450_02496 [Roseovarius albus]|uniref:Uncharacterized protein n=1 Tax=Roseovarius albus TaxID=1247867 RepID=A0A1X6ZGD7_9RHOB|nr:hypothetical protein [Roseovarius albus]SLN50399.1 hypothetical protein ROA7450_02496 [Roseovarius albus]